MDFLYEAKKIESEVIEIRRYLHMNPELGLEEVNTSKFIKKKLSDLSIEYKEFAKTGVCGIIKGEKEGKGKVIALRADIDGLPIEDKKECSYKSKVKGKMHGCGHDGHTAILLGVAKILNNNKKLFSGLVKLIFEPAEETVGGSRIMIAEGILKNPKVDAIFGLHLEEEINTGKIKIKDGYINASSNPFKIKVIGKGGHGAYPASTIDPIVISANIITSLQNIISREINPLNQAIITIGSINGGKAQNVIPEEVEMKGIIRTIDKNDREYIVNRVKVITENIAKALRGKVDIDIEESYPSLFNDSNMVEKVKSAAKEIISTENIVETNEIKMGVESFAYFAEKIPAAFYFLGCRNEKKGIIHSAHSNLFDIDEKSLSIGVAIQCKIAIEYLTT